MRVWPQSDCGKMPMQLFGEAAAFRKTLYNTDVCSTKWVVKIKDQRIRKIKDQLSDWGWAHRVEDLPSCAHHSTGYQGNLRTGKDTPRTTEVRSTIQVRYQERFFQFISIIYPPDEKRIGKLPHFPSGKHPFRLLFLSVNYHCSLKVLRSGHWIHATDP